MVLIGLMSGVAIGSTVKIGTMTQGKNSSFASRGDAQHCQVVALQEDIETAFEISSITFVFIRSGRRSYVRDFSLSMANVENDQLTGTFVENYISETLIEVFHTDSLHLQTGYNNELVLELDTPFFYNGQDNLLIDVYYPYSNCYGWVYNWEAVLREASGRPSGLVAAAVQTDISLTGFHT